MSNDGPVRLGIAGIGGYAGTMRERMLKFGSKLNPRVQLVAVCDPALERFGSVVDDLRMQHIAVHSTYDALLAEDIDGVWLPLPIQLHLPYTRQALAAGKAVMCEKPAAGTVDEVDAMIAARDAAELPVLIGFQDVYDPQTLPLKRRLLDGEIGEIEHVTVYACWPRGTAYFGRSPWAGRQRIEDTWVLDSPVNNAMAHFVNIAMFYVGRTLPDSAVPVQVEAELYRAAEIENFDTCSLRVTLESGTLLDVNYTHACTEMHQPVITLHGTKGKVTRDLRQIVIERDGQQEVIPRNEAMHRMAMQKFAQVIRGIEDDSIAAGTLEVARQHTIVVNGAAEADEVQSVPAACVQEVDTGPQQGVIRRIAGIEDLLLQITAQRQTMHESGRFDFSHAPGICDVRGYAHFRGAKGAPAD